MVRRLELQPVVGDWYSTQHTRSRSGALFEVVAYDDDDGTIEIQYFDGTVEEMDLEDWNTLCDDGSLLAAQPPEDYSGSIDVEPEDMLGSDDVGKDHGRAFEGDYERGEGLRAGALDGLDLFE